MLLGLGNGGTSKRARKGAICHAVRGSVPHAKHDSAPYRNVQRKVYIYMIGKRDTLSQNCVEERTY
jgi:hypothetical protein